MATSRVTMVPMITISMTLEQAIGLLEDQENPDFYDQSSPPGPITAALKRGIDDAYRGEFE